MTCRDMTGARGPRGSLVSLRRPDGTELHFARKLFANKRSNLQVFGTAGDWVVVKRVGQRDRIREEQAAIRLLEQAPTVRGFVPTASLRTDGGRDFTHAGQAFFCMPLVGDDLADYRDANATAVEPWVWAETVVSILSAVAATLLTLWRDAQSTYYDVKARNILAVRDLVSLEPPFSHHEVLLCDTGSINSPCATHHPPASLTQHAPAGSKVRYRLYIAWGMLCTLVELMEGPMTPRQLRDMRHMRSEQPIDTLDTALDRVLDTAGGDPEAYMRVLALVRVAREGVDGGTVDGLLSSLSAC